MVPNVPRYNTLPAASSSANSRVRTNRDVNATDAPSEENLNRSARPSPSSMCAYSFSRSNNPGPMRYSVPPRSSSGAAPNAHALSYSCSPSALTYACAQSACVYTQYPCARASSSTSPSTRGSIDPRRRPHPSVPGTNFSAPLSASRDVVAARCDATRARCDARRSHRAFDAVAIARARSHASNARDMRATRR